MTEIQRTAGKPAFVWDLELGHRLITADTVEEKVLELQDKKRDLADAIVNVDNAGISSLTREDLELLLA